MPGVPGAGGAAQGAGGGWNFWVKFGEEVVIFFPKKRPV